MILFGEKGTSGIMSALGFASGTGVCICLHPFYPPESHSSIEEIKLDTPGNNFERGREDRFSVTCAALGELKRLRIFHDNSGSAPGVYLLCLF